MSYAPHYYKGFRARLKTQGKKPGHMLAVGYLFGAPCAGLITYTCKKDESCLTAQCTILPLSKYIK